MKGNKKKLNHDDPYNYFYNQFQQRSFHFLFLRRVDQVVVDDAYQSVHKQTTTTTNNKQQTTTTTNNNNKQQQHKR